MFYDCPFIHFDITRSFIFGINVGVISNTHNSGFLLQLDSVQKHLEKHNKKVTRSKTRRFKLPSFKSKTSPKQKDVKAEPSPQEQALKQHVSSDDGSAKLPFSVAELV